MTMTDTRSRSGTNTYSDARARTVMLEVGADFYALASANLITFDVAEKWTEELSFVLLQQTVRGFQIQLRRPGSPTIALDYRVSNDGSVLESSTAGGINYYGLPVGTTAGLVVDFNCEARNIAVVKRYIVERGWGTNGQAVEGEVVRDRVYAKDGFGVIRSKVGNWS
jgi:hypothetical protein